MAQVTIGINYMSANKLLESVSKLLISKFTVLSELYCICDCQSKYQPSSHLPLFREIPF